MDHLLFVRHCDVHFSFISCLIFRMSQWAVLLSSSALYWWEIGAERGEETFPGSAWLLLLLYLAVGFLWPVLFGSSGRLAYSEIPLTRAIGKWVTLSQLSSQGRDGSVLGKHLEMRLKFQNSFGFVFVHVFKWVYTNVSVFLSHKMERIWGLDPLHRISSFTIFLFCLWVIRRRPALRKRVQLGHR